MILALSYAISMQSNPVCLIEPPGPSVGIQVVFGKKRLDCQKFGICYVKLIFDLDELFGSNLTAAENGVGYGYASRGESSRFTVKFIKDYMTDETRSEYFQDGKFRVEEDYVLPDNIIQKLGLTPGYRISEGLYNYIENSKEIILIL